jgi:hypothetical protein
VILACVAGRFPGISLRTAFAGYVFRSLLIPQEPPRPLPYRAQNGTGGAA